MLRVLHRDRFLVCLKKLAHFPLLDRAARFSPSSEVIDAAHPHASHQGLKRISASHCATGHALAYIKGLRKFLYSSL